MASPPFNLDTGDPTDTAVVAVFPANERSLRDQIASYLNTEHDINTGLHAISQGSTATRDGSQRPTGALWYNTTLNSFQYATAGGMPATWATIGPAFASGTALIFHQSAAPTGWTQDVTKNDQVLRVINGGVVGTGGSWTIGGTTVTIATHALSAAEIPAHTHTVTTTYRTQNVLNAGASPVIVPSGTDAFVTDNGTGGGGAHGHAGSTFSNDATWRPAYVDCIIATKN